MMSRIKSPGWAMVFIDGEDDRGAGVLLSRCRMVDSIAVIASVGPGSKPCHPGTEVSRCQM
jgi:hypothetical protein